MLEDAVDKYYDGPLGDFLGFWYDVLQLSSGRDKLCSFAQGFAKFASASLSPPGSEQQLMYRSIENNLSDGRKVFRLFKEIREVYKIRRGFHRFQTGVADEGFVSVPACCGTLDVLGHCASFVFFLFDNLLWAASVGIVRSKEIPKWQREYWDGGRRNGAVVSYFGGVTGIKMKKNLASLLRLFFAMMANTMLLHRAVIGQSIGGGPRGSLDDPVLFHALELLGMAASGRILLSRLGITGALGHGRLGLLAMLAAACGIWSSWRKVRRKDIGTKRFSAPLPQRKAPQPERTRPPSA